MTTLPELSRRVSEAFPLTTAALRRLTKNIRDYREARAELRRLRKARATLLAIHERNKSDE